MSRVRIRLPGRLRSAPSSSGVARGGALIGASVRAECDVGIARREGRSDEAVIADADENDVVHLQWEGGILELVRVGEIEQRFGMAVRSGSGEISVPQFRAVAGSFRGGPSGIPLESVQHIAVDASELVKGRVADSLAGKVVDKVSEYVLPPVVRRIEEQCVPSPGLYRVGENGALVAPFQPETAATGPEAPYLVLVHGTFSNTEAAFKQLFASSEWKQIHARYTRDRVLALEQRTVSDSPARNAIQLVAGLPRGARVHLLSHSRGGLVGDLLCRKPWQREELEEPFGGPGFVGVNQDLGELAGLLFEDGGARRVQVERFLRVASPAAGTQLAGRRLDQFLSVGLTLLGKLIDAGTGWFDIVKSIAVHIVASRTRADACPGLEAMMPDSPFIRFLNLATEEGQAPDAPDQLPALAVISGDVRGGRWFQLVKEVFADFYFRKRANDFVVDTASMTRGVPRKSGLHYHREGPDADHFSYFQDREVRARVLSYLRDGKPNGFSALARGSEPIPARSRLWLGDTELKQPKRAGLPTVFLVPGIMGTRLADEKGVIWAHPLRLAQAGLRALMLPGPASLKVLQPIEKAYERLAQFLERDFNVELFGYDWRKSIKEASAALNVKLDQALESGKSVHLLAHSMGGLVSRGLIAWHPDTWNRFIKQGGRLVMLGTPNYGSYVPAQVLTNQSSMLRTIDFVDRSSNLEELRQVVMDFPGLLEMLPKRGGVDWLDYAKWAPFEAFRPRDSVLKAARAVREDLDKAVGWESSMVYVAGSGKTPVRLELMGTSDAVFLANNEGDGTVPWELGKLDKVPTYYVNAQHGDLADHRDSFPGYLELLKYGRTGLLAAEARLRSSSTSREAAAKQAPLERLDPTPEPILVFPSADDILAGFIGSKDAGEEQQEPPLDLSVINGHLQASRFPIVVGHFEGDPITSVEAVLDRMLGGQMTRDHSLRIYPGPIGTMRSYKHHSAGERGAIVVGLGQVGALTRARLTETLREGLLRYAADRYRLAPSGAPLELTLSSLLIGSWGKLSVEDSVVAVIAAVRECNQRLKADPSRFVKYVAVQFIELYRDLATQAAQALLRLQESDKESRLRVQPYVRSLGTYRRNRPASHYGYYDRVSVLAAEDVTPTPAPYVQPAPNVPGQPPTMPIPPPPGPPRPEFINYKVVTGLARSDLRKRCIQWAHIEKLLQQAPLGDKSAVDTLFQYLLPFELKNQARDAGDLVLELDEWTAQIPWELMSVDDGESDELVRRGILRTLQITRPRQPEPTTLGRALVIGEPAGVFPPLPGARTEGDEIGRLLTSAGVMARVLLGADADDNFRALLEEPYDIVHIAAHGHYDEKSPQHSGVVLSNERFLTACEFENLRATPSIVFLNCCHLGRVRLQEPGAWGASVAEELIRIGVGVVVVAGWAVSDHAAVVFAKTLYETLLHGDTLMTAVRDARRKTREVVANADVTWGAYQIYGDPGFVLPNRYTSKADGSPVTQAANWVSPHQLVEQVLDLEVRASESGEMKGGRLDSSLCELWAKTPESWQQRGDVNAAFGKVFGALGNFEAAIEHYEDAIRWSDAETRAIEQLANYEGREAVRLLENPVATDDDVVTARALFKSSRSRLEQLIAFGKSPERYSLLAATLRRMARCWQKLDPADRLSENEYKQLALDAYANATSSSGDRPYYPLLQVQGMQLCIDASQVTAESLQPARENARDAANRGDVSADVVLIELDILEAAARAGAEPDRAEVTRLAETLVDALDASGAPQERRESTTNNWQTLFVLAGDPNVKAWLRMFLEACGIPRPGGAGS